MFQLSGLYCKPLGPPSPGFKLPLSFLDIRSRPCRSLPQGHTSASSSLLLNVIVIMVVISAVVIVILVIVMCFSCLALKLLVA